LRTRDNSRILSLVESIPLSFNDGKSSFKSFIRTGTVEPLDEDLAVVEIEVDTLSELSESHRRKRSEIPIPHQNNVVVVSGSVEEDSNPLTDDETREAGKRRTQIQIESQPSSSDFVTETEATTKNSASRTKKSDGTTSWSSSEEEQLVVSWGKKRSLQRNLRKSNPLNLIPKGFVLRRRAILDKSSSKNNLPKIAQQEAPRDSALGIRPDNIPDGMVWSKRANKGRGGLVYIRPLPGQIPKGMKWSLTANNGMGGLINIPPAEEDIPRGFGWSSTAKEGRGGLVRLPPSAENIPDGMEWNPEADNGMGALVNIRPSDKDIPAGKRWSYSANAGLGGLVDDGREFGSSNSARRRRRAMLQPFETGNAVNEIRDNDVRDLRAQRDSPRKLRRHKKLRKPFRRRRNTRNEPLNLEDWGIVVEEEDDSGLQGVDLSTAEEGRSLSRKSLFDLWRQSLPNDLFQNEP